MKVLHIARNTFRECVRDKVLYNLVIFAVLIIGSSLILGTITIGDVRQIIINLGLSTISFFGTLIAILIGIQLVHKEIDKKTVYSLLSKPVARHEFILGKYLGLSMTLAVNVSVMILGVYLAVLYLRHSFQASDVQILLAGILILIELMLVIAIALLFSTFSTPALSALFTFCLYVIGHFNADIRHYGLSSDSWITKSGVWCDVLSFAQLRKLRRHLPRLPMANSSRAIFIFLQPLMGSCVRLHCCSSRFGFSRNGTSNEHRSADAHAARWHCCLLDPEGNRRKGGTVSKH